MSNHEQFRRDWEKQIQEHKKHMPRAWKAVCPRRYVPPNGFENPQLYSGSMIATMMGVSTNLISADFISGTIVSIASILVEHQVPTFFIMEDFARAVAATEPPDYAIEDIHFPMPAMVFMLPPTFAREYSGYDCRMMAVAKVPEGKYPTQVSIGELEMTRRVTNDTERFMAHYLVPIDGIEVDYTATYPTAKKISQVVSEGTRVIADDWDIHAAKHGLTPRDEKQDAEFNTKMNAFALRLLLAMTARPTLIAKGTCIREEKVKKHGKSLDALWTPNTVGRGYRIVYERDKKEVEAPGTHVRMHWRRGHFRKQPYGLRDTPTYKVIWIDPVLVNAETKDG